MENLVGVIVLVGSLVILARGPFRVIKWDSWWTHRTVMSGDIPARRVRRSMAAGAAPPTRHASTVLAAQDVAIGLFIAVCCLWRLGLFG